MFSHPPTMGFALFLLFFPSVIISVALSETDSLSSNQTLRDGGQTLVSKRQRFELGFFNLGSSSNRYLGIWYKNLPLTVVWIANRNNPIPGFTGEFVIGSDGLVLFSGNSSPPVSIWSVNVSVSLKNPVLRLLENGNLVLSDENGDGVWQSYDEITDTLLPDMKLGWNFETGLHRIMTSWSTADDPSDGEYTYSLDPPETPQLILRKGSEKEYRWGPWEGVGFSGSTKLSSNPVFTPMFNSSNEEVYYSYKVTEESLLARFVVTPQGLIQYLMWRNNAWTTLVILQRDYCDRYGLCGVYGNCYGDDPNCKCLKGFTPKLPQDWAMFDWSGGCTRKWGLNCSDGDGFVKYGGLKLPDNSHLSDKRNLSIEECRAECLKNCSCMAYTMLDIHGNGGDCVMWSDDLVDMRNFPNGRDVIFIRMARAEIESIADAERKRRVAMIVINVILIVFVIIVFGILGLCIYRLRRRKRRVERLKNSYRDSNEENGDKNLELPLFSLETVSSATDKFSFQHKIGEGGFGSVYKGVLPNGQEIAVKRLSHDSGQGPKEFMNEVILIEKLQHRNLVKLLGCCIQGEERMLIYEYLPNKSLNGFLFDETRKKELNWKKRFDIILGIARGLLYLHQDSRVRIIHRDLKVSNILLDSEMNPKISDFGIARIFGGEKTEEKTRRVIGTYGYMSPEYALAGHFSVKSDVFSFGVLVLEILSGKKNWGFYHTDHDMNLLGHAWKLQNEGNPLELMDEQMKDSCSMDEVIRCIQVGLLCVQRRPEDRPTMSNVVFMLGNSSAEVPESKEPGFTIESSAKGMDSSSSGKDHYTANEMTVTALNGR